MKREIENLQDAVNSIHIKEEMQEEIIQNVKIGTRRKKYRFFNVAVAAAFIAILSGALSIPVRAFVNSLVQERMENVPEKEMTALLDDLQNQEVAADSLSRAYTKEEQRKMSELTKKYMEGTFPTGELAQVESVEEAEELGFCFLVPNSTFYLPDRELTEEELLQIIDFDAKREYALRAQQYEKEYADELARQKEDREEKKAEVIENGGITEEEAIEIAKEWLIKLYGITGDGLECNHYFSEDAPILIAGKMGFYQVNWTDFPNRTYYYFDIDAEDGNLARADRSGGVEKKMPAVTEAKALLPELERNAVSFAEEQLQQTYEDVYCIYYSVNDTLNWVVNFFFVREDNSAFVLTYDWNGELCRLYKSQFSTYQEKYEDIKASVEEAENWNHRGEKIEIHLFFEKVGAAE